MTRRALTILNETGDTTIMWSEDGDEKMIPLIQKKLDQGFQFFIIEPRLGGLAPPDTSKPLKRANDALKHRALSMRDAEFERMVSEGGAEFVRTPDKPVKAVRKSKSAPEIAKSESVATRPLRGG